MTTSSRPGITTYATPTDREIVITRVVDAPRRLVFEAYTTPKHLQRWLLGPEGWTMPVCEIDARPGGAWRYVWRKADGSEMAMGGTIEQIVPGERLVTTERWGPEWPETVNTRAELRQEGRELGAAGHREAQSCPERCRARIGTATGGIPEPPRAGGWARTR